MRYSTTVEPKTWLLADILLAINDLEKFISKIICFFYMQLHQLLIYMSYLILKDNPYLFLICCSIFDLCMIYSACEL